MQHLTLSINHPFPDPDHKLTPGGIFCYDNAGAILLLCLPQPRRDEIAAVRTGVAELALLSYKSVIFLLYKFGATLPWSDCPYTQYLVTEEDRGQLALDTDKFLLCTIVLVDYPGKLVRAMRALTFTPKFTHTLARLLQQQHDYGWPGQTQYDRDIAMAYHNYPNSELMLSRSVATMSSQEIKHAQ